MALLWFLLLVASLAALAKGADLVLDGAHTIGTRMGLSSFGAGAIIIGTLTSLPDLMAAIAAQLKGASDVVAGIAIGANIADIFLIAALIAVITRGVKIYADDVHFDVGWLVVTTGALIFVAWDGMITGAESLFLLLFFALYWGVMYTITRENNRNNHNHLSGNSFSLHEILMLLVGFAFLIGGAHFAVEAAIRLSSAFAISTGIIGLFAIALGTTLPELFITLRSVRENALRAPLALGNIFGSNIFNALVVVGLPGLIGTIEIDPITGSVGLWTMLIATLVFAGAVLIRRRISFMEGILYLGAYVMFVIIVAGTLSW
jgi:cation:H+ antiporter